LKIIALLRKKLRIYVWKKSEKRLYQKLPQQPLTLAGEKKRPQRPVILINLNSR